MRCFIALIPPAAVQNAAEQIIQALTDRYQTHTAKAPPHVTLQPPFEWSLMDTRLEQQLQTFADRHAPFPVKILNFGAFAPRVLFLDVVKTPELLALQSCLVNELETTLGIADPMKQRSFFPHLTIASRNLDRATFNAAWEEMRQRQVEFEFVADALTLLIHDGQAWQIKTQISLAG